MAVYYIFKGKKTIMIAIKIIHLQIYKVNSTASKPKCSRYYSPLSLSLSLSPKIYIL